MPRSNQSKTTNDPLRARASGRTSEGRRTRDLFRGFTTALGNPTDTATLALVLAAAELIVAAERARQDHFAGRLHVKELVRVENLSNRALRRIGLDKPAAAKKKAGADLASFLAARQSKPASPGETT